MDRWIDGDKWTDKRIDGSLGRYIDRKIYGWIDGLMGEWMENLLLVLLV